MKKEPQEIRLMIRKTLDVYFHPLETETWYKENTEKLISDLVKDCERHHSDKLSEEARELPSDNEITKDISYSEESQDWAFGYVQGMKEMRSLAGSVLCRKQKEAEDEAMEFTEWLFKHTESSYEAVSGEIYYESNGVAFTVKEMFDKYKLGEK